MKSIHSSIHPSIHSFFSFIHSFIYSTIHSFIDSFIHSFIFHVASGNLMRAMRSAGDFGVPLAWRVAMVRLMAASTSAVASSIELEMIDGIRLSISSGNRDDGFRCRWMPTVPPRGSSGNYVDNSGTLLNKPELATMRPDCVSACIDRVTSMDKQTVKQTEVRQE